MDTEVLLPSPRLRSKWVAQIAFSFVMIAAPMTVLAALIGLDAGGAGGLRLAIVITVGANLLWAIPLLLLIEPYFASLRYRILPDEVVVEAGVLTRSVKHVPYRTVTNLKMARGPFDRIFNLGTLNIQTAGMSGQSGAEESLIGLEDVDAAYDSVATSLRQYRRAMPPTGSGEEEVEPSQALSQILSEVSRIRVRLEAN